jgi:hypothetical protein
MRRVRFLPRLEALEGRALPSTVTNLFDAGPGSLRQAILDTPAGGTVDFQPGLSGTIALTTGELVIDKSLTVVGPGAGQLAVSGGDTSRVLRLSNPTTSVSIAGLTIAHGWARQGGGVYVAGGNVSIISCVLSDSRVVGADGSTELPGDPGEGGALYVARGTVEVTVSTLTGNQATGGIGGEGIGGAFQGDPGAPGGPGEGGAIYVAAGTVRVNQSTLNANGSVGGQGGKGGNVSFPGSHPGAGGPGGAGQGGAIHIALGTVEVTATTFRANQALGGKGGPGGYMPPSSYGPWGKSGPGKGGVIYVAGGNVTVDAARFGGNQAAGGPGGDKDSGGSGYGGVLYAAGGNTALANSGLTTNKSFGADGGSGNGGSVYSAAVVTITGCVIDGLYYQVSGIGGGILNAPGASMTVSHSVIQSNGSKNGGAGIYNDGVLTVIASELSANWSDWSGGAISNGGTASVVDSTFLQNFGSFGGAISNWGTLSVWGCTLSESVGGAIYVTGSATVTNSTIAHNSSSYGGGIWVTGQGTLTVTDSTISGNYAVDAGGGVGVEEYSAATISTRNTIIAGNTAFHGADVSGFVTSLGHNLVGVGTGSRGYNRSDLVGNAESPIDALLGPLQDNGGPTLTMALLPGSPAIDAGSNRGAPEWDQRGPGYPRIVNGTMDIGAVEAQGTAGASALVTAGVLTPAPAQQPQPAPAVARHRQGVGPAAVVVQEAREAVAPPAAVPHARPVVLDLTPDMLDLAWL